uniref:Uncharacterized protein LOC102800899 n=1 Tax=Saccoglossus kowalevskii TaxID=10224 RepID=A0ABM0LW91_SACKO|nr:PREDICTED: uncharacterized protein LOC102800899 [Saccoglossus kowalevskii]
MESRTAWNKWNRRMSCHTGNPYDQCTRKHCLHTDQYNVAAVIPEQENPPPLKDITQKVTCNQQVVVMDPSRQMKSRVNENTKQLRFNSCRGGTQDSGVWARHIRINQMKKQDIEPQRQRSSLVSVQRGLSQNKGQSSQDNTTSHLTHSINPNLMTEFTKKEQNKVDYYHCPWEQKEQLHGFTNNVSPWRCDISMNYVEFKENCPNYVIDNGQQETLGSSTNFYDGVKYRNHGPYGDCYDSQNTITTLIVPTTEIVLPLPLDTEYNQRPATLNTWNLELNENIHRDAGEWLVEPLLDAEHSSQGTDVERATDMARYQYDSTSSLHLSDLNRNQSYTAPSYHSAADVQDARHDNRYYGYQPSSVSSKEDLSELYYIPGQHKLMHLPARSRFSYAYGETAKHKYGYEDEYADTNSNHYDTSPRSQYSYIDTPRSQDTQDSYDSRYHETPRDSGFSYSRPPQEHVDESKSQYSRNGQNGYPLDRNGDCWSETASVDTKQDVNQVLLESAYYARKRRSSFGAVSPDWQRGSPDTSPSSRDQNQAYGALNAYTGFNGRSGRNGAVGDGRMSMSDTPNFRTAYSDHVAENRGSSTVPVTNGRYPGDGSHSRADTSSYPPQYMELTSGHTQQDSGYYTGYHKPEYNNLRDREPSQLESHSNASYPGYLYSGNYVNDYEGRSSPGLSHSGNSSSSKSKQSASTNDLTPREQTWTYSGAIYVDNNEMKSETPVAFGISSVPSVNQAQPVDSRSLPPSSTMPEGSRLSSYGVKVKPAGGSTTTMFDTSVGSHSSPSSSYTSQRSSNSVHSLQRSTSPEQRSVISGQRNTSPDQRSTSSVQKTSYTSRRCPSPSPTYPIQRSSSPAFTRPQGSKDAWRRHSYAEPSTVQEDFKTPLPSSFTSVSHKSHSLTQTSPVSARTTVQSLTQTSPSSATHSSSPHSRTTVRSSTQTTPPSATRSSSPHIQATIHSSSETSPPSATRGSSSLHRRSLSSPRVKFDTEEKENHYDNSYYADSGRLGDSYNSSRELSMNDLKTNQAEKPEIRRPSSPKMSLSSLGPSSRLKQSNTSLSVSSLNRSRSSSLDRMHDGKSSGFVKSRPISVKMSSSTEITPAMLQRFKKRISKPQIQSNVPVYTSTFLTRSGNHGNGDSHSRSTSQSGKGIQTSPGSTKTLNRMSSILWAMKLIELLHKTPSSSHDELVVQARWFRKWYTNVNRIKSLREEQNQMMEDAAVFWRRHLLRKCLSVWKNGSSPDKRNDAEHLHRRHMLTKGLQGLKYAICQKKQLEEKLAAQCQSNLLVRHFDTWKSTYHEHRHETLRHAFLTWQQFKLDTDKFKQLSCKHDKMKVSGAFRAWKDKHSDVQKEGLAGLHYKVTLFSKGFQSWRLYTSERRVKTTQNEMGKVYFEEKTFVKYFKNWQAEYDKFQIAKNHHSMTVLSKILTGWRRSLPIVRAERLQDMSEAKEFHKKALLKVYFAQWSLKLKQQIMQKMMNRNRLKQCFEVWYLKQQRQAIQRQIEESMARKTLKRRVLYAWMVNVRKQKEIRERFISVLHRIHVRQALCDWRQFTLFKKQLRKKMTSFKEMRNKRLLKKCCHYWMGRYNIRLQQIQSRQVWSDRCTMTAYKAWTEMVRRRRLEAKLRMTQPHRDSNLLQSAFRTWLAAKQQSDWDTQRAKSVQLILEHNNAYRVLTQWRLLTKQTKTIQPLVVRRERKEMAHVFDAWRSIVLRRRQCVNHYEYSQQNKLSGAFSAWKEKAELLQREKEVAQEILDNKLRRCMKGWRGVAQRTVQCQMLTEQIHHSKLQHTFDKWKESWEDLVEKRDDDEAQKAEGHILKSVFLGKWRDTLYDHKDKTDDVLKSFSDYQSGNTMKNAFFNWKKQLLGNQLAREYHDDLQLRLMRQVVQSWNGHAKQTCQDSVEKFKLSLGGPSSPTLSDDSTLSLASQLSETVSQNSSGFHSNIPIASTGSSNNGNHFDGYPGYPIHDEADRWDGQGMFPKPLSFKSNSYPSSLYSDSLHVEIPQNRQLTLKRIILHWKLYPASTAFQQWLSYTRKQKLLCQLQYHMQYTSMLLTLKHGMQVWKRQHAASVKAAEHWETKMKEKCLKALLYYKIDRKRKQHKTAIATRHSNSGDLMRAFLVWKHRTK